MKVTRYRRNSVKEAFDNLPSGICFFSENGIPVLCNRKMDEIVFALTGRDLQIVSDLTDALECPERCENTKRDGKNYILRDGSVWQFSMKTIDAGGIFTEIVATEVTDLYRKKQELARSTEEHQRMVEAMREVVDNIEDITREEEILTLKMQMHRDIGIALQQLRKFHRNGCLPEEKQPVIEEFEQVIQALSVGSGESEEADVLGELIRVAASLGVRVEIQGSMPEGKRELKPIVLALQECITNAIRHAGGTVVTVATKRNSHFRVVEITNNGTPPGSPIVEGGGLSSLRKKIEKSGGVMIIESEPVFLLRLTLPVRENSV